MHIGRFAALAIGMGLLAGCTTPTSVTTTGKQYPTNPVVTPCDSAACPVKVTVTFQTEPFSCTITVDPPIYDLSKGPATKTISWTLTNPNADWPPWSGLFLPIQFGSNAASAFSNPTVSGSTVSVTYVRPTGSHQYAYGVNARHRVLQKFCSIDPWLVD